MTAIRSQHARELEKLALTHRALLLEALAAGDHDHPTYKRLVGQVQGIDDALKLSEQADYNINGEEPDGGA